MIKLCQAFVLGKFPFRIPSGTQTLAADGFRGFSLFPVKQGTVLYISPYPLASLPFTVRFD